MKESVTKFDLEAAFKALDEIEIPESKSGVKANKPALNEIFSRKSKFDALFEEYYDISSSTELNDAKDARDAEIAKAKLARIEKIVDLEAESAEDLLTSYVGKLIIQCPQCMTLFYKDPEDVEESEDDANTVNVNEVCQHCGNESGYTLVGKVGEATQEEMDNYDTSELDLEGDEEFDDSKTIDVDSTEEVNDDLDLENLEDEDIDLGKLEDIDLEEEEIEEEPESDKKEESHFVNHEGQTLIEKLNEEANIDVSADEFEELINSSEFKKPISDSAVRAMLDTENDSKTTNEELVETIFEIYSNNNCNKLTEGTGAETANIIKDILGSISKDGKQNWTKAITDVIDAVPNDYLDDLFDIAKNKLANVKLDVAAKDKIIDAAGNKISGATDNADTLDEILSLINIDEIDESTLKSCIVTALGIVAIIEPTPIVDVITAIVTILPANVIKKVISVITKLANPLNLADITKKFLMNESILESYSDEDAVSLEEGIFDKLKDKFSGLVDKVTDKLKSREDKADWILSNAMEDYADVKLDDEGKIVPDDSNRRFKNFIVIGYTDKYDNGKEITKVPTYNNKNLVVGMNRPEVKASYKDADSIAKGWSMRQGNGPAFIYMAKDIDDDKAAFLCQYFKGELENDQLEYYFDIVKKDLKGAKLTAEGGMDQSDYKETPASEVEQGMKIQLDDETAEVTKVNQSRIGKNILAIEVKFSDGTTETMNVNATTSMSVLKESVKKLNMSSIMDTLEDLHESSLETAIANSLIEAHKNVAGFRLKDCSYINEEFKVDGTIHYVSGETSKTTYTFNEAFERNTNTVELLGHNKNLVESKQFKLAGYIKDKTLVTESFK